MPGGPGVRTSGGRGDPHRHHPWLIPARESASVASELAVRLARIPSDRARLLTILAAKPVGLEEPESPAYKCWRLSYLDGSVIEVRRYPAGLYTYFWSDWLDGALEQVPQCPMESGYQVEGGLGLKVRKAGPRPEPSSQYSSKSTHNPFPLGNPPVGLGIIDNPLEQIQLVLHYCERQLSLNGWEAQLDYNPGEKSVLMFNKMGDILWVSWPKFVSELWLGRREWRTTAND